MPKKPPSTRPKRAPTGDYEVGNCRPPVHGQFKPGQSGNRKGRPSTPKTLKNAVERDLDRKVFVTEAGRKRAFRMRELVSRQVVNAACRGDAKAIRLIRDLEGSRATGPATVAPPGDVSAPPLDRTDIEIIASFAALIRSGAALPYVDECPEAASLDEREDVEGSGAEASRASADTAEEI